jgi:hypothetical protein
MYRNKYSPAPVIQSYFKYSMSRDSSVDCVDDVDVDSSRMRSNSSSIIRKAAKLRPRYTLGVINDDDTHPAIGNDT